MNMRLIAFALAGCLVAAPPAQAAPDEEQPESSIVVVKKKPTASADDPNKKQAPPPKAAPVVRTPPPPAPATPAPNTMGSVSRPPPPAPPVAAAEPEAPLPGGKLQEPKKRSIAPLIGIGVSAAMGIAGAVFAAKAIAAVNEDTVIIIDPGQGGGTVELPPEFEDREKRVLTNGLAATILISAATSGLLASIISLTD